MTEIEMKDWIDNATYEQLLRKWRFASIRDPLFKGQMGTYFSKKMREKEKAIGKESADAIGKMVGD